MKRLIVLAVGALLLASCATDRGPEAPIVTRDVPVPVAVACAKDPGPEPIYADTSAALQAAADIYERAKLLLAGRTQRDGRLAELKAATAGCSALQPP